MPEHTHGGSPCTYFVALETVQAKRNAGHVKVVRRAHGGRRCTACVGRVSFHGKITFGGTSTGRTLLPGRARQTARSFRFKHR